MNGRINLTKLKRGNGNLSLERRIAFAFKNPKTVDSALRCTRGRIYPPGCSPLRVQGFDESSPHSGTIPVKQGFTGQVLAKLKLHNSPL